MPWDCFRCFRLRLWNVGFCGRGLEMGCVRIQVLKAAKDDH